MKLYHPQYEQFFDKKSGVVFEPEMLEINGEKKKVALADIGERDPKDFLRRGFVALEAPKEEVKPTFDDFTVPQLLKAATALQVDLQGATKKADIIAAFELAQITVEIVQSKQE